MDLIVRPTCPARSYSANKRFTYRCIGSAPATRTWRALGNTMLRSLYARCGTMKHSTITGIDGYFGHTERASASWEMDHGDRVSLSL